MKCRIHTLLNSWKRSYTEENHLLDMSSSIWYAIQWLAVEYWPLRIQHQDDLSDLLQTDVSVKRMRRHISSSRDYQFVCSLCRLIPQVSCMNMAGYSCMFWLDFPTSFMVIEVSSIEVPYISTYFKDTVKGRGVLRLIPSTYILLVINKK